jgi:hypothetical protein
MLRQDSDRNVANNATGLMPFYRLNVRERVQEFNPGAKPIESSLMNIGAWSAIYNS